MRKVNTNTNAYDQRLVPSGYHGMQRPPQDGSGFFGKIKNFFGDGNSQSPQVIIITIIIIAIIITIQYYQRGI